VPLYELIADFYAAIINDYLHIHSNNNSRHKLARNVAIETTSNATEAMSVHGGAARLRD